jgi:hypothetical protein
MMNRVVILLLFGWVLIGCSTIKTFTGDHPDTIEMVTADRLDKTDGRLFSVKRTDEQVQMDEERTELGMEPYKVAAKWSVGIAVISAVVFFILRRVDFV